jgi:MFS family permease
VTQSIVDGPERVGFRDVFGVAEFRAMWIAQAQSRAGDQLARVALALLVYDRTSSAALTALVYALTFLPPLLTAPLLAGLADRYSRRTVMVAIDLACAVLVAAMALPGLPLVVVAVLLVAMTCPQPLFAAARNATLPTVLTGERFPVGMGIVSTTDYLAQITGFAGGGVLVGLLDGPHTALLLDAGTFVVSAALVRWGIRPHRPSEGPAPATGGGLSALAGIGVLVRDRRMLGLAGLVWLFAFFIAPEALAAPYAHQIGAGPDLVGVLMAAGLVGAIIGTLAITRLPTRTRYRWTTPLAAATGVPQALSAVVPWPAVAVTLWAVAGLLSSYQTLAKVRFARLAPDPVRGRAIGVASAGLQTAQGLGVLAAGALADVVRPSLAIGLCGAAGTLTALLVGLTCRPASGTDDPD